MNDDERPAADASVPDPFEGPGWDRSSRRVVRPQPTMGADDAEVHVRREWRRRSKYARRRKRRRILMGSGIVALAVLAVVGWLLYTGLRARHELEAVRAEVRQLRSEITAGDLDGARSTAKTLRSHADDAHDLTTGPLWAGAAAIPWLGEPLESARTVTSGVDQLADGTLPDLVEASKVLDPNSLRAADGSIDLSPIATAAPELNAATRSLADVISGLRGAPSSTWLGSVDTARSDLLDQLSGFQSTVNSADTAANVVPTMLGADGPRSYLVSFENEAELRGTGGLPGAFAILQIDHGKFHFSRFESDTTLGRQATGLDFGIDYDRLWAGSNPTDDYRDSNVSPHFPYAAQVWAAQWKTLTGQQLDGAVALDPTALSYLLKVTGPAALPDGTKVSAANAVALTQNTVYLKYGAQNKDRKKFLLTIARAVSTRLIDTHADTTALVRAAAHAVSEGRLLVWSRDPGVEAKLAPTKISGTVPDNSAPYMGLALNNATAGKLDYYLHSSMSITRSGCGDTRDVTVTMTFRNASPGNLTPYMYGRYGGGPLEVPHQGDTLTLVSYYATRGGALESITLDGKPSTAASGIELGHPVFTVRMYLQRGEQHTVVLHLKEPATPGTPTLRVQPTVQPVHTTLRTDGCG